MAVPEMYTPLPGRGAYRVLFGEMGRSHWHPKICKVCGQGEPEGVSISQKGYCQVHWAERDRANHLQLKARSGEFYDHWKRRNYLAARRILLDEAPPKG